MAKLKVTALKLLVQPTQSGIFVSVTPADNVYVLGGVQLDLTPGKILDPGAVGVTVPSTVPSVTPGVFQESLGGYYAQVIPATAKGTAGLSTYKLQYFSNAAGELPAGAYPNAITNGSLILFIP